MMVVSIQYLLYYVRLYSLNALYRITLLCYVMSCFAMSCCVVLCYVMPCYIHTYIHSFIHSYMAELFWITAWGCELELLLFTPLVKGLGFRCGTRSNRRLIGHMSDHLSWMGLINPEPLQTLFQFTLNPIQRCKPRTMQGGRQNGLRLVRSGLTRY